MKKLMFFLVTVVAVMAFSAFVQADEASVLSVEDMASIKGFCGGDSGTCNLPGDQCWLCGHVEWIAMHCNSSLPGSQCTGEGTRNVWCWDYCSGTGYWISIDNC